jgi:hypothetical protein
MTPEPTDVVRGFCHSYVREAESGGDTYSLFSLFFSAFSLFGHCLWGVYRFQTMMKEANRAKSNTILTGLVNYATPQTAVRIPASAKPQAA